MKKIKMVFIGETADVAAAIQSLSTAIGAENAAISQLIALNSQLQSELASIASSSTDTATVAALQSLQSTIAAETSTITAALPNTQAPGTNTTTTTPTTGA